MKKENSYEHFILFLWKFLTRKMIKLGFGWVWMGKFCEEETGHLIYQKQTHVSTGVIFFLKKIKKYMQNKIENFYL